MSLPVVLTNRHITTEKGSIIYAHMLRLEYDTDRKLGMSRKKINTNL